MPPQTRNRNTAHDDDDVIDVNEHDDDTLDDEEDDDQQDRGDDLDDADADDRDDDDEIDDDDDDDDDEGGDEEDDDADDDALREIAGDSRMVPRARLNEVLERLRVLEAQQGGAPRNDAAADTAAAEVQFDLTAKIRERNELLLEGDTDAAGAIDGEIAAFYQQQAARAASEAATQVIQQEKVQDTIAALQKRYPVLNDRKKDLFDRDTLDEVVALRNVYIARGEPMHTALRKAADRICGRGEGKPGRSAERRQPEPNQRSVRQMREAVRTQRRTPAPLNQHGASGRPASSGGLEGMDEERLARMSPDKFRQIDEREKARARGDFVEPRSRRR